MQSLMSNVGTSLTGNRDIMSSALTLAAPLIATAMASRFMGSEDAGAAPPTHSNVASNLGHGFASHVLGGFGSLAEMAGLNTGPSNDDLLRSFTMQNPGTSYVTKTSPDAIPEDLPNTRSIHSPMLPVTKTYAAPTSPKTTPESTPSHAAHLRTPTDQSFDEEAILDKSPTKTYVSAISPKTPLRRPSHIGTLVDHGLSADTEQRFINVWKNRQLIKLHT